MRVRVEYEGEMGRDERVVQGGLASRRVGVKTSQAQGGGGLAQAKSSSLLSPMALQSGAVESQWQNVGVEKHDG